jgi:2-oxoglutarate ferredoxin oxidoreductase subunit beta
LGINLANHRIKLISVSGDGDYYSEGGNHFIHAARRNLNVAVFAGDNRVYGLTKGQASPTSPPELITPIHPEGVGGRPLNPAFLALAAGATFVARSFSGNGPELTGLMQQAIMHPGFALVDILFPCLSFNKINTFGWFKERVQPVGPNHDPANFDAAVQLVSRNQETIPTGLIYRIERPTYDAHFSALRGEPLARRSFDYKPDRVRPLFPLFQ